MDKSYHRFIKNSEPNYTPKSKNRVIPKLYQQSRNENLEDLLTPIPISETLSDSKKTISIKNLLAFKFDDTPTSKTSGKYVPLTSRVNHSVEKENIKKDLEIVNLTSINKQLLKAQENKSELVKSYYQENTQLKKELSQMKLEIEALKNHISKLKFKIKHYKIALQETGGKKNILEKLKVDIMNDLESKEKKGQSSKRVIKLDVPSSKIKGIPLPPMNKIRESFLQNLGLASTLNLGPTASLASTNNNFNMTSTSTATEILSSILNKRKSIRDVEKDSVPSFFKSSLNVMKSADHYKRLTLNYIPLSNNENLSLQLLINGQKSLFRYDSDLVGRIIQSPQFGYLEKLLVTYDIFKHNLEIIDETKLDDIYFIMKGVVNDYKSTLTLLAKINRLVELQHIFCERVMMNDIFERICEIVCQTLECDRSTLYLVDNAKKELWSKAAKDSKAIIKLPFGKGLAGYVAESKKNLVLDDAYFDPRFNREYDMKTGYRTKSVICVPIFDLDTKIVIGVIQSLNKKSKPYVFDVNDEITSELLSRMIGSQLKHSIEFSDYMVHENKLKKLITSGHHFFLADTLLNLVYSYKKLIMQIFSSEKVNIIINLKDFEYNQDQYRDFPVDFTKSYYKIINDKIFEPIPDETIRLGMVGCVIEKPEFHFCHSTYKDHQYNPTIDLDTSLPVITMPIRHQDFKSLFGIVQYEHNVARLTISDFRVNQVDQIDYNMIHLMTRMFALNVMKFLVHLDKNYK